MQGRADFDLERYDEDGELKDFDIRDYLDIKDIENAYVIRALNYNMDDDELEYETAVGYDDDGEYFDDVDPNEDPDNLYQLVDQWMIALDEEEDDEDEEEDDDEDVEWYDDDEDWGDDEDEDEDEEEDEDDIDIIWE